MCVVEVVKLRFCISLVFSWVGSRICVCCGIWCGLCWV